MFNVQCRAQSYGVIYSNFFYLFYFILSISFENIITYRLLLKKEQTYIQGHNNITQKNKTINYKSSFFKTPTCSENEVTNSYISTMVEWLVLQVHKRRPPNVPVHPSNSFNMLSLSFRAFQAWSFSFLVGVLFFCRAAMIFLKASITSLSAMRTLCRSSCLFISSFANLKREHGIRIITVDVWCMKTSSHCLEQTNHSQFILKPH